MKKELSRWFFSMFIKISFYTIWAADIPAQNFQIGKTPLSERCRSHVHVYKYIQLNPLQACSQNSFSQHSNPPWNVSIFVHQAYKENVRITSYRWEYLTHFLFFNSEQDICCYSSNLAFVLFLFFYFTILRHIRKERICEIRLKRMCAFNTTLTNWNFDACC